MGKIGLNQSSIYIHPFPSSLTQFFYMPLFSSAAKILFLSRTNIGGAFPPPDTPVTVSVMLPEVGELSYYMYLTQWTFA